MFECIDWIWILTGSRLGKAKPHKQHLYNEYNCSFVGWTPSRMDINTFSDLICKFRGDRISPCKPKSIKDIWDEFISFSLLVEDIGVEDVDDEDDDDDSASDDTRGDGEGGVVVVNSDDVNVDDASDDDTVDEGSIGGGTIGTVLLFDLDDDWDEFDDADG